MAMDIHNAAQPPVADAGHVAGSRLRGRDAFVLLAGAMVAIALGCALHFQIGWMRWASAMSAISIGAALTSLHLLVRRRMAQVLADIGSVAGPRTPQPGVETEPAPEFAPQYERRAPQRAPAEWLPEPASVTPAVARAERAATPERAAADIWDWQDGARPPEGPVGSALNPPNWAVAAEASAVRGPQPSEIAGAPWPAMIQPGAAGERMPPPLPRPIESIPIRSGVLPPRPAAWLERTAQPVEAAAPAALATPAMDRAMPAYETRSQTWSPAPALPEYRQSERAIRTQPYQTPHPVAPSMDGFEHLQGIIRQLSADVSGVARNVGDPRSTGGAAAIAPALTAEHLLDAATHAIGDASAGLGRRAASEPAQSRSPAEEAVAANRIDVLIAPIATLADRRACHYDVSVRLQTETGEWLGRGDAAGDLRRSGSLGRLDAAALPRMVRVARWLLERGRASSVFSQIAGDSLADDGFLDVVATELGDGQPPHLVLGFSQGDVRAFGPMHFETLATMREIGVRFAIEDVVDLDMDFDNLRRQGFEFVKLDARVFLDGLPAAHHTMPPADLCRYLANQGLTLIVGEIGDLNTMARIFGMGVQLGQGELFGAAKSIKAEILEPARPAARTAA